MPSLPGRRTARKAAAADDARLDRVFGALSDPTRRSLLSRLAEGTARVTDLAAHYPVSLNTISKHLKVLEAAGLVTREVDGRVHRCTLDARPLQNACTWLDFYQVFWTGTLAAVASYVESGADIRRTHRRRRS
jgi:DNA-binding transcriptional ArsR family regulator